MRKLTEMQVTALERLEAENNRADGPVGAFRLRCNLVWYVADVMKRLAKRGMVTVEGSGESAKYEITALGQQAVIDFHRSR
jgi:predicted transcriptional regulator